MAPVLLCIRAMNQMPVAAVGIQAVAGVTLELEQAVVSGLFFRRGRWKGKAV